MSDVDPRLVVALERQLRRRAGERVGWKLGIGDRERIGDEIAVGHLTAGEARLVVNGEVRDAGPLDADLAGRVRATGRILAAVGERLERGDLIITGSIVQVPLGPGDEVEADAGALGGVQLRIAGP